MKRTAYVGNIFVLVCIALLIMSACHNAPKIQTEVKNITVDINAPKAKVFEIATLTFIKGGFTISVANEGAGLITTDFKVVDVGFREAYHLAMVEESGNPQIQFGTSIIQTGNTSVLTMVAKGLIWKKKRGYVPYVFSDEFMNSVRAIGEQIKAQAEAK
jgi:hypothetical protein